MAGRFTVETVFKGTDNTSGVLATIGAKTRAFQNALSGPSKIIDKGFAGIKQVGVMAAAAGAGAVGLGLAFKEAITPGADFDQAMSAVGAVSLMTRDQVADLEKEARRLGRTTKFSATEVAGGMELMGKAGFDNTQIIAGIGPVLAAAAAEGAGLEETTSIVSNVMKGMGLQMSETGRVADVLTLASARTNSSISSLGESMAIVAPTARQLKVPLEDAVAAVAMLQDVGIDASTSGSAVTTMLTNLAKPPKAVAAQMRAMGVSFQDAHGDMLPFKEVVDNLAKAGKKAGGNMAQVAFFADLVGLRGQKAALNLKDLTAPMAALNKELHSATGSAEKMAALKMDNFKGDMTKLGNLATDVGIDFFDLVKGPLRNAVEGAKGWLADNQELVKTDVAGWVQSITDNVRPLRENIEKGVQTLGWFKDGLSKAFEHSASVVAFGNAIDNVFGGKDGEGPGKKAYDLGYNIGYAVDKFVLFTAVVKTAEGVVWLFSNATKVAQGIHLAYKGVVAATTAVQTLYNLAAGSGFGATVAFGGAMTTASIGAGELAIAEEAATVGAVELEAAAVGAEAGVAGIGVAAGVALAPIAAVAAALAAVAYAGYQAKQFMDENGGSEGAWAGVKGVFGVGTDDWGLEGMKQGIDEKMNAQARAERDKANGSGWESPDISGDAGGKGRGYAFGPGGSSDAGSGYGMTPALPPGPYAGGYQMPAAPPLGPVGPVVSARDHQSDAQAQSSAALKTSLDTLSSKLNANGGTIKLILPKGVTAETSGAPGVEVQQSGGF